jgi:predicted acetyltransferase
MVTHFEFLDTDKLIDNELQLVLEFTAQANPEKDYVPAYFFNMFHRDFNENIGKIDLRIGFNENIFYGGQVGYMVLEKYRGNRYAMRSLKLIFELAKNHDFKELWVNCHPENIASKRTLELAGGKCIEIVNIPKHIDAFDAENNENNKRCRFKFEF